MIFHFKFFRMGTSVATALACMSASLRAQTDGVNFPEIAAPLGKIGMGFWETYWLYIFLLAVIAALIAFIVFRKRPTRVLTPYETAMLLLANAKAQPQQDGEKKYAERVSDAVRGYIAAVCKIPAPEQTTPEFILAAAQSDQFGDGERKALEQILKLADMAKFARHSFMAAEREELFNLAQNFVQSDNLRRTSSKASATAERQNAPSQDGATSDKADAEQKPIEVQK